MINTNNESALAALLSDRWKQDDEITIDRDPLVFKEMIRFLEQQLPNSKQEDEVQVKMGMAL